MTYTDDEGDEVTLIDDQDLKEWMRLSELTEQKVLRINVSGEKKKEEDITASVNNNNNAYELTSSLKDGKAIFALSPAEGMRVFVNQGLVEEDAVSVARFLHNTELSWAAKGEYLSDSNDSFASEVLLNFVDMMNLQGCTLDEALRKMALDMALPRAEGKLDKIMTAFSKKYKKDNPESKLTVDAVYVLAFALLILSSNFHENNMTQDFKDFASNLEGVNSGDNFPEDFLNALFENVKKQPITPVEKPKESLLVKEKKIQVPTPSAPPIDVVAPPKKEEEPKEEPKKPRTAFESNLEHLEGMGFTDRKINIQVLVRNRNNLDDSIQELLKMK